MEHFHLTKWYMDCAHAGGEAFIGYWAELHWRRLKVRYASAMAYSGGRLQERSSLRPGRAPRIEDGMLAWTCAALDTHGSWKSAGSAPGHRVLLERGSGKLEWHCLLPSAEATVRCGERLFRGQGYAELLTLTIPPWDLPIDELRWGRAHFPGHSVVWIDWSGTAPQRLVLMDGVEVRAAQVTDDLVLTARGTIRLTDRMVLREGPMKGTSAGSIPGVRRALSRARLRIDEHKWLSAAALVLDETVLTGQAIHEVVKWR